MKTVLTALAVLLFSSLAANAGETVVAKGIYNAPGHMDQNDVVKTSLQPVVTGTVDRLPTKEERELLEKRLTEYPYSSYCPQVCQEVLARVAPASAETDTDNDGFARGSAD